MLFSRGIKGCSQYNYINNEDTHEELQAFNLNDSLEDHRFNGKNT